MNKSGFILILLAFCLASAEAQVQLDSLNLIQTSNQLNFLSTKFDKQLNTYNLFSQLNFYSAFGKINLRLNENYNSTYIKSSDRSSRDEHFFSFAGGYDLNKYVDLGISADNNIFSDSRRIEINQASLTDASVFARISPFTYLTVAPFTGYENNRQVGESDYGMVYGAEGYLNDLELSDFILDSQLKFKNEDISPRKNALRYFNVLMLNNFAGDFSNSINFQYLQNRKDFYYAADSVTSRQFDVVNNIQSRIETNNVLQDRLNYANFLSLFNLNLLGRVSWRTIDRNTRYRPVDVPSAAIFDTKINELKVEFESMADYRSDSFDGQLKLNYSERDEKHIAKDFPGANRILFQEQSDEESTKNNTAIRATLAFTGLWKLSGDDNIYISAYQNKLRYDTPSPLNYDDRDELLSIVRLRYEHKLTPYFTAFINTEGTYNHIVYIYSENSSNNNVNRIIKLSSGGTYYGRRLSSTNIFEVSANYTVYDFEDISTSYRSYSFRQFTAIDSSRLYLTGGLDFVHYGYIKLSEQGDLKWASFSTHPTRYLQEIYSEPKFTVHIQDISLSAGIRFYSLSTFNYNGPSKELDSKYLSLGPITEILLFRGDVLNFNLIGWYEFVHINSDISKQQANLTMQMTWKF